MTLQKLILLTLTLSVGACSGMIQSTSITEAYKKYDLQEYDRTLELITRAENTNETSPEMKAELTYLKAQTHENLGQGDIATNLVRISCKRA